MAINSGKDELFDESEAMTPAARDIYFNERLAAKVDHAYRNAPAAKKLLDGAGITPGQIRTVKDLEKLPITRKADLIEMQKQEPPFGGFLAIPPEEVGRIFISPGPIYEIQSPDIEWFARSFWAAGFRKDEVALNTFTYHMSPAGILFHEAIRACGATVVVSGTGNTDMQIQIMKDLRVSAFVGTPSFLMTVIKRAEEMKYDFKRDFGVKRAWFTGEMLAPSLRVTFEGDYDIDTFQAYAVTEPGGAIAYECREKNGLHLMDDYITEIVDPQTGQQLGPGEIGEIVVTPLHDKAWGLLRFGTGDLSSYVTETCPCGRTANRITGIAGRIGDAFKVRGMFVVGKQAEQVIMSFPEVKTFRLSIGREEHRDQINLKIELAEKCADTTRLFTDLNRKFQEICRIKIDTVKLAESGAITEDLRGVTDERKWE